MSDETFQNFPVPGSDAKKANESYDLIILGAGPAGLSSAFFLSEEISRAVEAKKENNIKILILEKDSQSVGGLAKTVWHEGFGFDIGGHRFHAEKSWIKNFWISNLEGKFLYSQRKSSIYFDDSFIDYPLRAFNSFLKLGPFRALQCLFSYLNAKFLTKKEISNFESWMVRNFGRKLYRIFFKDYTEKILGISTTQLSVDWARERIGKFSLGMSLSKIFPFYKKRARTESANFLYPPRGPGQFWLSLQKRLTKRGVEITLGQKVTSLNVTSGKVIQVRTKDGKLFQGQHVLNTLPLSILARILGDDEQLKKHCSQLKYRHFLTVNLIFKGNFKRSDQWIYIQDKEYQIARIQNPKAWSNNLCPHDDYYTLSCEIFCSSNDGNWVSPDERLIQLALDELEELRLVKGQKTFVDGFVRRYPNAYPIYDLDYKQKRQKILKHLTQTYPKIMTVGRGGSHSYQNQDHVLEDAKGWAKEFCQTFVENSWKKEDQSSVIKNTLSI